MPQKFNNEGKQINISNRSIDDENESLSRDKNEDPHDNQQKFFENQYQPQQFMRLFPGNEDPQEEEEQDPEYDDDIEGIMQYQHKILRKYAMLGMIQYSAVPFFHHLVLNRDYKMICIFEVFALNRNEDDFLENLGILNEIRLQNEDS